MDIESDKKCLGDFSTIIVLVNHANVSMPAKKQFTKHHSRDMVHKMSTVEPLKTDTPRNRQKCPS